MAQSKNNIVTHGLSGKVGDILVFSQRGGKTIVGKVPAHSQAVTDKQLAVQSKFQQAVIYAQASLGDNALKAEYAAQAKKGLTAYNVAVADFFNAPDIQSVDLSNYNGGVGNTIAITVTDDFKVVAVRVKIYNADGSLVEEGEAVQQAMSTRWLYTATADNQGIGGDKMIVQAIDNPGNMSAKEQIL